MAVEEKTVYAIVNTVTHRMYIGSTSRPLKFRIECHLNNLRGNRHSNSELQADFNKYGEKSFGVSVLEEHAINKKPNPEYVWIEKLRTYDSKYGYNTTEIGVRGIRRKHGLPVPDSPLKGRKLSAVSCKKKSIPDEQREINRGRYLRYAKFRDRIGATDAQVASGTGISQSTLSDWGAGNFTPAFGSIVKIANYLGVSANDFEVDEID